MQALTLTVGQRFLPISYVKPGTKIIIVAQSIATPFYEVLAKFAVFLRKRLQQYPGAVTVFNGLNKEINWPHHGDVCELAQLNI